MPRKPAARVAARAAGQGSGRLEANTRQGAKTGDGRRFVTTTVEVEGREETRVVEMPAFEPVAWDENVDLEIVGQRVARVDAEEKVTGRARYTADIQRPGMLYAAILRSRIASGRVTQLQANDARAMSGVRAVLTRSDIPEIKVRGFALLDQVIRFAGQPIAAVCASSEEIARRALQAIAVEYDVERHVVTSEDALALGAPRVRGVSNRSDGSPVVSSRGDVKKGLAAADVVVAREYRTPVALHSALEPHATVAEWSGDRLTVWESTQGIFRVRDDLAAALELPLTDVRVIKDYMGGGFGAKTSAGAHTYVAALLARQLGRPVRCINDREAEQMDSGNRPATKQRVTLGAKNDGTLTVIACEAIIPLGIGGWEGGPGKIYHEMYSCPNVRTSETFVYVNSSAMSAFRAPGHVEGAFGLERAIDTLARELGMDPLELRMRNYAEGDEEKDRPYTGKKLDECYRQGAERFGWAERRGGAGGAKTVRGKGASERILPAGGAPRAGTTLRRGFGMASQVWSTGGGPPAYAIVRLNSDGTADVLTGTQDLGTGARTVFTQIAAESLGARLNDVRVIIGDTERTPFTGNSWGSMTTASVGPAVRMAAEDAKQQFLEAAAELMNVTPNRLTARDSIVRVRDGRKSMSFAQIAEELGDVMIIGRGTRGPNPEGTAIMTFGAQFVEVEVDAATGVVRVVRLVAAHDAGRIINPTLAESQLEGGIIQGIGYALFEERILDHRIGVPVNPTLHDYKVPTMSDVPSIDAFFVKGSDTIANHTGARGIAEPPIIPTAPAIANAVADALGVEVNEIPLTPWRVIGAGSRQ